MPFSLKTVFLGSNEQLPLQIRVCSIDQIEARRLMMLRDDAWRAL